MFKWKPTGRIRRLIARSTPSVIAPGRSKSPLLPKQVDCFFRDARNSRRWLETYLN